MEHSPSHMQEIKNDLKLYREQMLNLLELEQQWPAQINAEEFNKLQGFIQKKEAMIRQLESLMQKTAGPQGNLQTWLKALPEEARQKIATDLDAMRELTQLTLEWHHKNLGQVNQKTEELAKLLHGVHQELEFMQALRKNQPPAARMDLIG